ncbi:MAG: CXXX repeat peptide modification system protein [Paludibacteraceae bacterium]|nr:CXXX repeat peptide modification system protein [Paludibacteraceae bacterium]
MNRLIGTVSEEEKNEIQLLFERKKALNELSCLISQEDELYSKLQEDKKETSEKYQKWWTEMSQKYNWGNGENSELFIDFESNKVYSNQLERR